jgi:proteic killer suppression protein
LGVLPIAKRKSAVATPHAGRVFKKNITPCVIAVRCYYAIMIRSFRCNETQKIFGRKFSKKLPSEIQETARMKLVILDAAMSINDLRVPPGNRLEELKGDRQEQHSIRINNQWRICFEWRNGDSYNVEIVDYH